MLKPQCFGDMHAHDKTCALGAAMDAEGLLDAWEQSDRAIAVFEYWKLRYPVLLTWAVCPVCHGERLTIDTIVHLNDKHEWSRERIADWLEHIEAQHEAGQAAKAEPVLVTA
jgi:hypothetical protein